MSTPDRAAPYRTLPAARVADTTTPVRWLLDGLFLAGGAGILGGAPKTGKSFFALDLAVAVPSGTPGAGHWAVPTPGPVLLLAAEDPLAVVVQRLAALAAARDRALATLPLDLIIEPVVRLPEPGRDGQGSGGASGLLFDVLALPTLRRAICRGRPDRAPVDRDRATAGRRDGGRSKDGSWYTLAGGRRTLMRLFRGRLLKSLLYKHGISQELVRELLALRHPAPT
jgi:hypothetical protein